MSLFMVYAYVVTFWNPLPHNSENKIESRTLFEVSGMKCDQ